jgi:hypothetical protein
MIKSRRMRWAGHVVRMRIKKVMCMGFWRESPKERDNEEELNLCGRIILGLILDN